MLLLPELSPVFLFLVMVPCPSFSFFLVKHNLLSQFDSIELSAVCLRFFISFSGCSHFLHVLLPVVFDHGVLACFLQSELNKFDLVQTVWSLRCSSWMRSFFFVYNSLEVPWAKAIFDFHLSSHCFNYFLILSLKCLLSRMDFSFWALSF